MTKLALKLHAPGQNVSGVRLRDPLISLVSRFSITRQIGTGAFSTVYEGHDDGKKVAIKIIKDASSQESRNVFFRELCNTRYLEKHVPRIERWSYTESECYFTMELCEMPSLKAMMKAPGFQVAAFRGLMEISKSIARMVASFHARDISHLDLKPSHIFTADGKIIDFGLSRRIDQDGPKMQGTPSYMSPEQIDPEVFGKVGNRSDIYSLGIIYFMLFSRGRYPFEQQNDPEKTREMHIQAKPALLQDADPSISPIVSYLVNRMLAKNQEYRIQRMSEVLNILEEVIY